MGELSVMQMKILTIKRYVPIVPLKLPVTVHSKELKDKS